MIKNIIENGILSYTPFIGRRAIDKRNRKRLKNKDFSIISSNCTGGVICHDLGLQFRSPFVNLYILPKDYIKMLENLYDYMQVEITEEKNCDYSFPVGKLKDIHVYFQHYKNFQEAKEKWNDRKKRINWKNMYFLFSDRDGCTIEDIQKFNELNYENKLCFTHKQYDDIGCTYYFPGYENNDQIGILTHFKNEKFKIRYLDSFDYVKWLNGSSEEDI